MAMTKPDVPTLTKNFGSLPSSQDSIKSSNRRSVCLLMEIKSSALFMSSRFSALRFTARKDGREVTMDNRWVALYNLYLLNEYSSHIIVEICGSIQAVKYKTRGRVVTTLARIAVQEVYGSTLAEAIEN